VLAVFLLSCRTETLLVVVDSYIDKLSIGAFVYAIRNQKSNCGHNWLRAFRRVFLLLFLFIIAAENDNIDHVPRE